MNCTITLKNMTSAEKARRILEGAGIYAKIVNTDPRLTKKGCTFGIGIPCEQTDRAKKLLRQKRVNYGEVIKENSIFG